LPIAGAAAKSLRAGLLAAKTAAKTAKGATAAARSSAVLRAFMDGSKTSSFLRVTGRELTDFVVPVFSTRDILRLSEEAATQTVTHVLRVSGEATMEIPNLGGASSVHRGAQHTAGQADLIAPGSRDENLLEKIYDQLHRTGAVKKI